jgi:hypothetical protein
MSNLNRDTFLQIVQSYAGIHPEDKVVPNGTAQYGWSFLRPGLLVKYWPIRISPHFIWSVYTNTDNLSVAAYFASTYQEAFEKAGFELLQDSDVVLALAAANRSKAND